jgi:hypothetical protein
MSINLSHELSRNIDLSLPIFNNYFSAYGTYSRENGEVTLDDSVILSNEATKVYRYFLQSTLLVFGNDGTEQEIDLPFHQSQEASLLGVRLFPLTDDDELKPRHARQLVGDELVRAHMIFSNFVAHNCTIG